jgi:hypothetical protein
MEHIVTAFEYYGYSVHRNNIEEMTKLITKRRASAILWRTPNQRQVLKNGDTIIVAMQQHQIADGDLHSFGFVITPIAVYSSSVFRRFWSKGQRATHINSSCYHVQQVNPQI